MPAIPAENPSFAAHPEAVSHLRDDRSMGATAVVYCEGQFGEQDGKTANGLVRHSEKYQILSVIDSTRAGADAGSFLDGTPNGIPVLANLGQAIAHAGHVPDHLICGWPQPMACSPPRSGWCSSTASPAGCTSSTACTSS